MRKNKTHYKKIWRESSITAPQDAHKRLQVAEWHTASLYQCSREEEPARDDYIPLVQALKINKRTVLVPVFMQ